MIAAQQFCPGPCNSKWREAERAAANPAVKNKIVPKEGDPIWCSWCASLISTALNAFPEQYALLEAVKGYATPDKGDGRGSRGGHRPATPQFNAQDKLVRWLWDWEQAVRRARQLSELEDFPTQDRWLTLNRSIHFLLIHLSWALANPDFGEDLGREIRAEMNTLERATKSSDRPESKPVPCEACNQRTLVYRPEDIYVRCMNRDPATGWTCGAILTLDEYDAAVTRRAQVVKAVTKKARRVAS